MDLAERINGCRGLERAQVSARLDDVDQDDATRLLIGRFGASTDVAKLPGLPFTVRHTLYGDADVSEWSLRYGPDGFTVSADPPDGADMHVRWEHWEDAVRVLNGDVAALSLLYSRRVVVVGQEATFGEPPWFDAVDFAASELAVQSRMLSELTAAALAGRKALAERVAACGIGRITEARALVVAHTLVDAGGAEELAGSFMRMIVPGDPPVIAQVDYAPGTALPGVHRLPPDADDGDLAGGVTLRYASADAIVAVASGQMTFDQLLVNALVKIEGDGDGLERFGRAVTKVGQLYGVG